jgi:Fe-S oxidoreductase
MVSKKIGYCRSHLVLNNHKKMNNTEFGGNYEVRHHTTFFNKQLINEGHIKIKGRGQFLKGKKKLPYHDSCYSRKGLIIFMEAPRKVLEARGY